MSSDDHNRDRPSQGQSCLAAFGFAGVLFLLGIVLLFGLFVGTCLR